MGATIIFNEVHNLLITSAFSILNGGLSRSRSADIAENCSLFATDSAQKLVAVNDSSAPIAHPIQSEWQF
jgi:hypothetical protein